MRNDDYTQGGKDSASKGNQHSSFLIPHSSLNQWLDYSIRWAEHNHWQGATETDKSKWKYKNYGEGQDYVLFGDWQICFQTYIDLYLIENGKWRMENYDYSQGGKAPASKGNHNSQSSILNSQFQVRRAT